MKGTLVVLDDQEAYITSLARALRAGYDVIPAHTLEEAKAAISGSIKFILADVRLDENDPANREGLDFARWARETHPKIPFVAMSAIEDPSLPDQARAAGAVAFLPKPVHMSELKRLLSEILSKSK